MRTVNSLVGSPIERLEDLRFLRGRGQYVDDLARGNMLHAAILRSRLRTAASARSTSRPRGARRRAQRDHRQGYRQPRAARPCGCSRCRISSRSDSR